MLPHWHKHYVRCTLPLSAQLIGNRISAPKLLRPIQHDRSHSFSLLPPITIPLADMLSSNPPTPQTALLAAAQGPIVQQESSFDRGRSASEVVPRVYLTDLFTARNKTQLSALGITHVISVLEHAPKFPETHGLRTLHIPLSDRSDADILAHLPATTSFIHDALAESPDSRVMVSDPTICHVSFD
jgi:hypothetical protein